MDGSAQFKSGENATTYYGDGKYLKRINDAQQQPTTTTTNSAENANPSNHFHVHRFARHAYLFEQYL